jgi:hypothetical protein
MVPVVVMEPTAYPTSETGMVSAVVPPPVVQALAETVAVQAAASRARLSVTVTGPTVALMVVPGAPEPRGMVSGAVIVRVPVVTVKVTVVSSGKPGPACIGLDESASAAGPAVAADAATGVSAMPAAAATARIEIADLTILLPL